MKDKYQGRDIEAGVYGQVIQTDEINHSSNSYHSFIRFVSSKGIYFIVAMCMIACVSMCVYKSANIDIVQPNNIIGRNMLSNSGNDCSKKGAHIKCVLLGTTISEGVLTGEHLEGNPNRCVYKTSSSIASCSKEYIQWN